jgi:hypothetical protein
LSIFFDVEAAFDKVWLNLKAGLIYKLAKAKIPYMLLKFIINFINGRKARVKVGNCFQISLTLYVVYRKEPVSVQRYTPFMEMTPQIEM